MNNYLLETQRNLMRQNESEGARGHDLRGEQSQNEATYLKTDNELVVVQRELEMVRESNKTQLEAQHFFKQELLALQGHIDLLALQNNDLQKELDEFVQTDEIIRSGLDRKGRIQQMKERNTFNEMQSIATVERSKSPPRTNPNACQPLKPMNVNDGGTSSLSFSQTQSIQKTQ